MESRSLDYNDSHILLEVRQDIKVFFFFSVYNHVSRIVHMPCFMPVVYFFFLSTKRYENFLKIQYLIVYEAISPGTYTQRELDNMITFHCVVVYMVRGSMVLPYHANISPSGPFYKFGGK